MLDLPARKKRARAVLRILRKEFPDSRCSLDYSTPLELIIAVILSAQCTDERVNKVTPEVFRLFPTAADLDAAPQVEIEEVIRSTGFFRNKAKSLKGLGGALIRDHDSELPDTMAELVKLPGVGRKTANVILGEIFAKPEGVVVDTHVMRISRKLGLADEAGAKNPVKIERELAEVVAPKDSALFGHLIIDHGRKTCIARRPRCGECPVFKHCEIRG